MTTLKADIIDSRNISSGRESGIYIPDVLDVPGSVLQVQHRMTNVTTTVDGTSGVYAATDNYVTITPKKENSKILVVSYNTLGVIYATTVCLCQMKRSINGGAYSQVSVSSSGAQTGTLYNSTIAKFNSKVASNINLVYEMTDKHAMLVYDSPNTTSEVTYKVYLATHNTGNAVYSNVTDGAYVNDWHGTSSITAYEVSQD